MALTNNVVASIMLEKPPPFAMSGRKPGSSPRRILLVGDSGTGKTRFLGTMPKPFICDFDHGLTTLDGHDTAQAREFTPDHAGWLAFKNELNLWRTQGAQYGAETFALDSLTMAADAAMNYVLQKNGRAGGQPTIADWGEAIREVKDALGIITTLKCHVCVTAHAQLVKDEVLGDIQWLPLIFGKDLPHRLGIFFDDVFHTTVVSTIKGGVKVTEYKMQVKPDARLKIVKTRLDPTGTKFELYETPDYQYLVTKAGG